MKISYTLSVLDCIYNAYMFSYAMSISSIKNTHEYIPKMRVHTRIHLRIYILKCVFLHTYTRLCTHTFGMCSLCVFRRIDAYMHVHIYAIICYICVHILYMHIYTYIYIFIYIYICYVYAIYMYMYSTRIYA